MIELNTIYNEDCLDGMKRIPDKSIDMILCDLPYGTTACRWDTVIPLEPLWELYSRIVKDNGAIVLFCAQPFTATLVSSNLKNFRYCMIWDKVAPKNFLNAKRQPLRRYEEIAVFYRKQPTYNPLMEVRGKPRNKGGYQKEYQDGACCYNRVGKVANVNNEYYPTDILKFSNAVNKGKIHPTQKPVELFECLIRAYTNEGDTVLDNCMGSGTTAIAAINTNREYIGFEMDCGYYKAAQERIFAHRQT